MHGRAETMPCDVAGVLEWQANRIPDDVFFMMQDSIDTFAALNEKANRFAHGLAALGARPGELVTVMMANSPQFMYAWFGILKLGAVEVPINTAFRGPGLTHLITICKTRFLILDERYLEQIAEISDTLTGLETVIVRGDLDAARRKLSCQVVAYDDVFSANTENPVRDVGERDRAMVLFTSGTTGRSKGCVLSHRYLLHQAGQIIDQFKMTDADTLYSPFPLFHADAAYLTVLPSLLSGARSALSERFSASRYWSEVRKYGATVFDFMGATLSILWKQPPRPDDADNPVRLAWGVPMPEWAEQFEKRFDLQLAEVYGLTDAGVCVFQPLDELRRPGACGKPVGSYDLRIFDDRNRELAENQTGEIVIRPNEPGIIMEEYLNMPAETWAEMSDLWFHTGDLGFLDEAGYLHFIQRKKDSIRRRGENISAFEIEETINLHPAILESAAIGVPSELSEEDVMVWIVLKPDQHLSAPELIAHCEGAMADYMVPRYVQFTNELPKTPTEKVEKFKLAGMGVSPETWDRDSAAAN